MCAIADHEIAFLQRLINIDADHLSPAKNRWPSREIPTLSLAIRLKDEKMHRAKIRRVAELVR